MMKNNDDVYQTLPSLFIKLERIKKIKKKLNNEDERKTISEIFIEECNKLLNIKTEDDEQNFMASSFIFSNNEIIEWSLKYCNNNTKENYLRNKQNISSFS